MCSLVGSASFRTHETNMALTYRAVFKQPLSPFRGAVGVWLAPLSTSATSNARIRPPPNLVLNFVPQQQAWIVERFGRYTKTLKPGLNILIPVIDTIKYVQSLKETAIEIPSQSAITEDNVTLHIDGVLYYRVVDPYNASYGVEDHEFAVVQLAQTTMRSELGKIKLDSVFRERTDLNASIVEAINHAAEAWGIRCMRYEIRDIQLPTKVREAMQMQVEAERKKRANILESEGVRESAINRAEGLRQSTILASEALRIEQINKAKGEASAIVAKAVARSEGLGILGEALGAKHGSKAASLAVAEQYVQAFSKLAKTTNTVLLPENAGNISSMVAQAMAVYGHMVKQPSSGIEDKEEDQDDGEPSAAMKDLEQTLKKLNENIDATLSNQGEYGVSQSTTAIPENIMTTTTSPSPQLKEEPQFTLASSPTYKGPLREKKDDLV